MLALPSEAPLSSPPPPPPLRAALPPPPPRPPAPPGFSKKTPPFPITIPPFENLCSVSRKDCSIGSIVSLAPTPERPAIARPRMCGAAPPPPSPPTPNESFGRPFRAGFAAAPLSLPPPSESAAGRRRPGLGDASSLSTSSVSPKGLRGILVGINRQQQRLRERTCRRIFFSRPPRFHLPPSSVTNRMTEKCSI